MQKINLPLILDTFFCTICAFLFFFTLIRYYTKQAVISLLIAIVCALVVGVVAFIYISKKSLKKKLSAKDEATKQKLSLHLSLSDKDEIIDIFSTLFCGEKVGENIQNEDNIYFLIFCLKPLSPDDITSPIKFDTTKNKVVLCNFISDETRQLADNFSIKIIELNELYLMLKAKQLLPEKFIFEGVKKVGFFRKIKGRFNRKLSLPLFGCGLTLTLFSFITFFPIYYIITGGILLILSAVSLVIGKN
jgi:hypothetical protein